MIYCDPLRYLHTPATISRPTQISRLPESENINHIINTYRMRTHMLLLANKYIIAHRCIPEAYHQIGLYTAFTIPRLPK